jgi:hypothetical protein
MCFQAQGWFSLPMTSHDGATHFLLSIVKKLRLCCVVDMTAKGACVTRAGDDGSTGDKGTAGNTKRREPGKPQALANCHVNVAT